MGACKEHEMIDRDRPPETITPDTRVEEIVEKHPRAVGWLVQRGVVCVACGEPFWGTLAELMAKKKIENPDDLIQELNEYLSREGEAPAEPPVECGERCREGEAPAEPPVR
jgi:hypothetical protein